MVARVVLAVVAAAALAPAAAAEHDSASAAGGLDLSRLRLGDGKSTTAGPRRGYVYACMAGQAGQPLPTGPWIHGSFWDYTSKPTVDGAVDWARRPLHRQARPL